jgi:hypothetical protein
MGTVPGAIKLVKAGFVVLDVKGAIVKIIAFQYNPETLVRRLEEAATSAPTTAPTAGTTLPGETVPIGVPGPLALLPLPTPHETVSFTIALDAADKLQAGDAVTQQNGIYPALSALELLLYPQPNSLTVWVSGSKRVLPVRITQMQVTEQMFDPSLNPIRAEVSVALQVLKDADLANSAHGKALWDAHYNLMQQLATAALSSINLGLLGITGI